MFYYIKPMMYPVILVIVLIASILGPYFQSSKEGTIGEMLPWISQTGVHGVAEPMFSLLFSLYAFISFITMTWRFEQIKAEYNFRDYRCLSVANMIIYGIGMIACIGVLLLAHFRLDFNNNMLVLIHNIGTYGAFGVGLVYFILQTVFSFLWRNLAGSRLSVNIVRVVLSVIHTALFITYIVLMTSYSTSPKMVTKIAPIIQWIYAFLITIYSVTYIPEFIRLDIKLSVNRSSSRSTDSGAERHNAETKDQFIHLQDYRDYRDNDEH